MSSNIVITAEGISKRFAIGGSKEATGSLRETIMSLPRKLFSRAEKKHIWALDDVSFSVNEGDSVAIMGHNGSGKSTLLKVLSRITEPTKGRAFIRGRVASMLEVGAGFHPELTGRENIYLNGSIMGMSRAEIRRNFDAIVDFAEVELFLDTPVKHFSSGMYTRLAFAVAAHIEPDILIVDEVLAVGDVKFQQKCLGKMQDVAGSGRTVLFVSHNLAFVRYLCKSALLLEKGKLIASGSVEEVIGVYTASLATLETCRHFENERPGNDRVKIVSIEALGTDGIITREPTLAEGVTLRITFEVVHAPAEANFTVTLNSQQGGAVFQTLSNVGSAHGTPLGKGTYFAECRIPGDLLNEGTYWVDVTLWKSFWTEPVDILRAIALPLVDDGSLRKEYPARFEGVIRPRCAWRVECAS